MKIPKYIKSNKVIKLFSAGALIGSAFFSINAHAQGGCPEGFYPPGPSLVGACTRVNNGYDTAPEPDYPVVALFVDKRTDRVYEAYGTKYNGNNVYNAAKQACQADGGDCIRIDYTGMCAIDYKRSKSVSGIGAMWTGKNKGIYDWVHGYTIQEADNKYQQLVNSGGVSKTLYRGCPADGYRR